MNRNVAALALALALAIAVAPATAAAPASGWSLPVEIQTSDDVSHYSYPPSLAVDPAGNAFAAWAQSDGVRGNVWANHFVPGQGWAGPVLLESGSAEASSPAVAVGGRTDVVVVWQQHDGTRYNIWAARFAPASGWSAADLVETDDAGDAISPRVAMDSAGNATAVWQQTDGASWDIKANRFTPGSGWGTPDTLDSGTENAFTPDVGADASGGAVAVWMQFEGTTSFVFANRFTPGSGWGSATKIESGSAGGAGTPHVAVFPSGAAVALWRKDDGTRGNIESASFTPGSGWSTPAAIESGSGDATSPQVAAGPKGTAVAVWTQAVSSTLTIFESRYATASGWGSASSLSVPSGGSANPQVAVDASGGATAAWIVSGLAGAELWYSHAAPGGPWSAPALMDPDHREMNAVALGADGSGTVTAAYTRYDSGYGHTWAQRFVPPDTTPPMISIDSPASGLSTDAPSVWVSGTAEPGASVFVNGVAAAVAPDGSFGVRIALAPGANTITATASDGAGNTASASVSITFTDPASALATQLAAARRDLNTTRDALTVTQSQLADTEAELTAASIELGRTRSNLTDATATTVALSTQVATLSILSVIALFAALAAIGLNLVQARRAERMKAPAKEDEQPPKP